MSDVVDDDAFGSMTIDYVNDSLTDFDCNIIPDESNLALQKLNAFSTFYSITNGDLLNGLIAYSKNCKKTTISLNLLDNYENQVLKFKKQIPSRVTFREIETTEKIENLEFVIKSKFTGTSFKSNTEARRYNSTSFQLPDHRIYSDCNRESYLYGHSNIILDIHEIMPWLSAEDYATNTNSKESKENETFLTGSVFPSDGTYLTIESAILLSSSNAFNLNLDKIDRISLFPGMKLTVKCILDKENCFVQQVIEPEYPIEMAKLGIGSSNYSNVKIFIASGPFYAGAYKLERIQRLIYSAKDSHADALILIGPFVNCNDDSIEEDTPEALFTKFLTSLQMTNNTKMRVYLVPNCQTDLISMPYFPTPPLFSADSTDFLRQHENVTFLPDPAVFEFEGIRFAVSSSEILMHLCKREIYKSLNNENEDRMYRIISKLFSSNSLYPIYPADPDLSFSLHKSYEKIRLDKKPHVLILPSKLQPLIKEVEGTLVINPGRFTRGNGSGSFALLEIDLNSAVDFSSITPNNGISISPFAECSLLVS